MARLRKTEQEAQALGRQLKYRRLRRGFTLVDVALSTGVDVGQLSRFESGSFSFVTENLQKFEDFLQVKPRAVSKAQQRLVARFADLLQRSSRHEKAGMALLQALEGLQ